MTRRAAVGLVVATLSLGGLGAATAVTTSADDGDRGDRWSMMGQRMQHGPSMMGQRMHHAQVESEHAFLAEMIAHHEEAISAAAELQRSGRAQMRRFGAGIVASQSAQVEQMERWLEQWYADKPASADYEPMMRDLTGLSGDRLDEAFLSDMVGHHMGAVMMSQQFLMRDLAEHPAVAALAAQIRDEQHAEILTMQRWLQDWFGGGWRHGMHPDGRMMPGPGPGRGPALMPGPRMH